MKVLRLALRMLGREWRSGELGVLLLALTVAVAALTGVGFLVNRISAAVALQAGEVLAADVRLGSPQPLDQQYFAEATRRGLRSARSTGLLSVVFNGDASQLTNVTAVNEGYPLRGQVLVADAAFATGAPAGGIPARGEVWPDSRLLAALGAHVGSDLSIGAASLRVGRVLIAKPDQGSSFAELAPSALMNVADLPATQLIQPGSRVSYAGLFAGERDRIDGFKLWLRAHKRAGERLRDITDASPQLRNAIERSGRFLSLASLVSVLLCAIAVAMAARRYVYRHLDTVALLKTLGASRAFTLALSVSQLLALALAAALVGRGARLPRPGVAAAHDSRTAHRDRAAAGELCPPGDRFRHGHRRAGRLRAAPAAAARARAGAAGSASRRGPAAAARRAGLRTGGGDRVAPHLLGGA